MRISFVIPAYNEEERIGRCIERIQREVGRTGVHAEIIVVNNASLDKTRPIAKSYEDVQVVDEPRKGLTFARQAGFEHSTGELIANIDADVLLPEGWVDTVLQRFGYYPDLVALSGPFIYYDLPLYARILVRVFYAIGLALSRASHALSGRGAMLQGGNFVLRRDALERIGGFDTSIEFYGEDTDIAQRMATQGRVLWTFALPVHASGRRLKHEGIVQTGLRYALNFFSVAYAGKPVSVQHVDVRTR